MASSKPRVDGIINFRDVGETINEFLGERRLREGLFYRSARLDDASAEDAKILLHDIGLQSILDLRTKSEKLNEKKKHDGAYASGSSMPGLQVKHYHRVSLAGSAVQRFLVGQLSWWSLLCVIFFYIIGQRNRAITIIVREVMLPRGLVGMAVDTLDHSGVAIADSLHVFSTTSNLPALTHCTLGKDRTGLIVILILMILGVPRAAIEHDYALTAKELAQHRGLAGEELPRFGLTEKWGTTADDMVEKVEAHLQEVYGGLEAYMDGIGFVEAERRTMREALLY